MKIKELIYLKEFIHKDKIYSQCSDQEKEQVMKMFDYLERRILGLETQNTNLKQKERSRYIHDGWLE